jgi:hypothetical protein
VHVFEVQPKVDWCEASASHAQGMLKNPKVHKPNNVRRLEGRRGMAKPIRPYGFPYVSGNQVKHAEGASMSG